jgi:ketosteroid isomerase-like protein
MTSRPLLLAVALTAVCVPALAAEEPVADLRGVFAAHEKALDSHDMKGVMALFAPGDKTAVLGTGPGEQWVGSEQIADAYQHFFADFDPGTLQRHCPWVLADVSGDIGWLSATCEYQDSLKDKHRTYALNVSVVLQKLDGVWKLRTMHFSNPTAP